MAAPKIAGESPDSSEDTTQFVGRANPNALMTIRCAACHHETIAETCNLETMFTCPIHGWMATARNVE